MRLTPGLIALAGIAALAAPLGLAAVAAPAGAAASTQHAASTQRKVFMGSDDNVSGRSLVYAIGLPGTGQAAGSR